jgi:Tfp pilus assembly protein PilV
MKKVNNNGFTLIESIISFMVITLATGMFILGFTNVASLMSDSAIIKNQTNQLYNQLNSNTDIQTDTGVITINGEKSVNVDIQYVYNSDHTIRLSKFTTDNTLSWLPSGTNTDQNETTDNNDSQTSDTDNKDQDNASNETAKYSVAFRLVGSIDNLPQSITDITYKYYAYQKSTPIFINDASSSQIINNELNTTSSVNNYLTAIPVSEQLSIIKNSLTDSSYLNGYSDFEAYWFAIGKTSEFTENYYNHQSTDYVAYGVLVPKDKTVLFLQKQYGGFEMIVCDENVESSSLVNVNYSIDNKTYTQDQIKNKEFINNNKKVYFGYIQW